MTFGGRNKPFRPSGGKSLRGGGRGRGRGRAAGDGPSSAPGPKRRRRDDDLDSIPSDDDDDSPPVNDGEEEPGAPKETADEKRYKVASEILEKLRAARKNVEDDDEDDEEREDMAGSRDSLIQDMLQKQQLEESGRACRQLAKRVLRAETQGEFRPLVKHRQSVTAVALAENDDSRGFSASKDGIVMHWDVESGKSDKYAWPSEDVLISHFAKPLQSPGGKRGKQVLAIAVSSDGRYLATGGVDRHIHLWDTRTRQHIQACHGHRGPVSCLTFRQGTSQLFSGSFDRTIKSWNVDDRTHLENFFGHHSHVLTIDCLRRDRVLTVGRDRTMRLWKVPEESQLLYRGHASSLECGCFINDSEFLSGSDDGSLELWSVTRKKPVCILKNAHTSLSDNHLPKEEKEGTASENGSCRGGSFSAANSWVSSVAVCRGSDLAASGSANGMVCLWGIESDEKIIRSLSEFPLVGYVNSLAFARSGRFLLAGVGKEPRLGRWGLIREAQNGVAIHPISLEEE